MPRNTAAIQQAERAQLNRIANQWAETGEYPAGISETTVQDLSQTLFEQLNDRIDTLVAETTLTRREAEVWALTKHINEYSHALSENAVALLYAAPNTGFGDITDSTETTTREPPVTSQDVEHYLTDAKKKIEDAQQTIGALTCPNRDNDFKQPEILWLDSCTIRRLEDQRTLNERTLDDVITRCLDEAETRRSLSEFVRGYLNARGKNNVAQLAIDRASFETGSLFITSHTPVQDELPDIVTETDAITYHGHRYNLQFNEDPSGPHEHNRITLYASDTIVGMDGVTLNDGLTAADEHMQELLERDNPLPCRQID